jgi:hypothetical protein
MTVQWAAADFHKLADYDATTFDDWITDNLTKWITGEFPAAFMPVQDRFNLQDPIECQLADMVKVMPQDLRTMFMEGLELALGCVSPNLDLYDALILVHVEMLTLVPV